MGGRISLTAAVLRAMLQYIDPVGGPRIAADDDSLAEALVEKVRDAVEEEHGSTYVTIFFSAEEAELQRQFTAVAEKIARVFERLASISQRLLG